MKHVSIERYRVRTPLKQVYVEGYIVQEDLVSWGQNECEEECVLQSVVTTLQFHDFEELEKKKLN